MKDTDPSAAPTQIARRTLKTMAQSQLPPVPANYCRVYRQTLGAEQAWVSICEQTRMLEAVVGELLAPLSRPDGVLDATAARALRGLMDSVHSAANEADFTQVRAIADALGGALHAQLAGAMQARAGFVDLIKLIVANVRDLAGEDNWFDGQAEALSDLIDGPASPADLERVIVSLRGAMDRQRELRRSLSEAQRTLKAVLADLVSQAADLAKSTSGYEAELAGVANDIEATQDPLAIGTVVDALSSLVLKMGDEVRKSRDEIVGSQRRATAAEQQISQLRQQLVDTSERARRDLLTGAMNRTGLDEMWQREIEEASLHQTPLSLGLLDIDNFKRLNDTYGHTTGDAALKHLVAVVQDALRGIDTVARYGGEEFVILLPDTDPNGARAVLQRLQRELTKRFFLRQNERVLITFSAGATAVRIVEDTLQSAVERADAALYEAKRSGKNRVCIG